jgi:hypothetical protein
MAFIRTIEDFTCTHCGAKISGNGYTNHCPECLWSTHVDNDPGDRAAVCGGDMEPVRIEGSTPSYRIMHRCQKCGIERKVSVTDDDSAEAIIDVMKRVASTT